MVDKNLLEAKIKEHGLTQKSLAELVNMSKNTLNSKINGRSRFDTGEIEEICKVLDIRSGSLKAKIFLSKSS